MKSYTKLTTVIYELSEISELAKKSHYSQYIQSTLIAQSVINKQMAKIFRSQTHT